MLVALWITDVLLAIAFIASGVMKLVRSNQALVAGGMGWLRSTPRDQVSHGKDPDSRRLDSLLASRS